MRHGCAGCSIHAKHWPAPHRATGRDANLPPSYKDVSVFPEGLPFSVVHNLSPMRSAFVCFLFLLVTSLTMGLVATKSCAPLSDPQRLPSAAIVLVQDVVDSVEELWDDIASAPVCSALADTGLALDDHCETMPSVAGLALAPLPRPGRPILPAIGTLPERHERLLRPPAHA